MSTAGALPDPVRIVEVAFVVYCLALIAALVWWARFRR